MGGFRVCYRGGLWFSTSGWEPLYIEGWTCRMTLAVVSRRSRLQPHEQLERSSSCGRVDAET